MSRLLKITDNGNGILVQGTDNILFPDNATLTFPYNSIILVTDESDIATFRSASNNDVLFSGLIGNIQIGSTTVTKANIIENFDAIANQESGGQFDPTNYYTKSETNTLLEDKADVSDIPTDVSELNNDAGYITQSEVIINESFPVDWLSAQSMTDLIQAINDDSDAVVGKVYMDTISLSDLPAGMQQAEVKVEIMSELGDEKVILFTVTSSNTSPYHWEYTSAYGATGIWREWLVSDDIANFFDGAEYDSNTKRINFKHGNTVKTYIDATAFIKDGMVDTVAISNGNLVITFNTDAGKQPISIPLTDIFNPSNYYDKTATDTLLAAKADASSLATVATSGSYEDLTNKPTIPSAQVNSDWDAVSGVAQILNKPTLATVATTGSYNDLSNKPTIPDAYTKTESDNKYLTKAVFDVKEETISAALNDLDSTKQDTLTAGANITITNNVISATGGGGGTQVQSDWAQSDNTQVDYIKNKPTLATVATSGSYNDLSNKPTIPDVSNYYNKTESDARYASKTEFDTKEEVIATALNDLDATKQDVLTAGANITITNNVISATGGTQVQADWNETDTSDPSYIQNKPTLATVATSGSYNDLNNKPTIPDVSNYVEKSVYNQKEIAIANALTDLNENKADKTQIPTVPTNVSAFTNDAGYIGSSALTNYYTKTETDSAISTAVGQIDLSSYMTTSAFDVKEEVISAALNNLNTRKVNNGGGVANIVKLTQSEYDLLQTKDASTLYIIVSNS